MPLIFVLGGRRTGTTLLQNILCSDGQSIPGIGEAQLLTELMRVLKWGRNLDNFGSFIKFTFENEAELAGYFADIIDAYVSKTLSKYGARFAVFKNPEYSLVIDELLLSAPNARFVVSVRDPRDQVVSEIECEKSRLKLAGKSASQNSINIVAYCQHYNNYYHRLLQVADVNPNKFLFVRYEDLLNNFTNSVDAINAFTGMNVNHFDPENDWPRNVDTDSYIPNYPSYSPFYGKKLERSRVGRFKRYLSDTDIGVIERECRDFMLRFGYHPVDKIVLTPLRSVVN